MAGAAAVVTVNATAGKAAKAAMAASADGSDDVYTRLLARWTRVLIGAAPPEGNADYTTAVRAEDRTALRHLSALDTGPGRTAPWDDLPLGESAGPSSNVTGTANRLRAIATGCATPASELYGNEDAAARAADGVRLLLDTVYHPGTPEYGNWWDWEIGVPKALGDTAVLLGAALPAPTLTRALASVDHFVPDPKRMLRDTLVSTGANRVDLCLAVAVRGALGRSPAKLVQASEALAGVLDPVLIGDGFHPDGSFVMHTCVAYPGTYGQVLVKGMGELMRLLKGTPWDVAAGERTRTVEAVERTFLPFVHGGLMVDSVRGRAIARTGTRDADNGFSLAVDVLGLADALPGDRGVGAETVAVAERFRSIAKGWLQRNTWRPLSSRRPAQIAAVVPVLADPSLPATGGPVGHFAFPGMERFSHRRAGWTFSLALNSDRIARFEYMNGENARGWHTGDGMVQLHLDSDLFHYTDDYWPTVDAKRLPGTTVDTAPLAPGEGGDNDHEPLTGTPWSGGVALTDPSIRSCGLASIDLTGVGSTLTARKSWLFLDDAVLCAGSGIGASGGRRIETTVENRGTDAKLTVDGREVVPDAQGQAVRARWAHVGGLGGYVFLAREPELNVLRETRTGSWRDLNQGGPTTPVTRRYLTLWHDHGTDPDDASYAYLQLPAASFPATAARAAYPGVETVALTRDVHAFRTTPGGGPRLTAAVFFAPGSAAGITVDEPCSVLVLEERGTLRIAVSDPSRSAAVVRVGLDRRGFASVSAATDGLTVLSVRPLSLLAETGARRGATLTATLGRGRPAPRRTAHLLPAVADATVRGGAHAGESDGTGPLLTVRTAPSADDTRRAYLAFDLGSVRGRVVRAVLWLHCRIPNDPGTRADDMFHTSVRAHGTLSSDWSETALTWDNAPALGLALGTGHATVHPGWTALDVTAAVTVAVTTGQAAGARLSLAVLQPDEGHEVRISSREGGGRAPILEVVTSVPTATSATG